MNNQVDEISKKAIEILGKPYARHLVPDEAGGYVASIQEFPGCVADGNTAEEAIANLNHAAASWIEAALSTGYEIRDPVDFYGYSGKIALRIPRGLHKQIAELAELEESSINQLLVTAIANYTGSERAFNKCSEVLVSEVRKVISDGFIFLYRNGPAAFTFSMQPTRMGYHNGNTVGDAIIASEVVYPKTNKPLLEISHT